MIRQWFLGRGGVAAPVVGAVLVVHILMMALGPSAPWSLRTSLTLLPLGLLMVFFPSIERLPKLVLGLSLAVIILGASAFLPVDLIGMPEWRRSLEELGVDTGKLIAVQSRLAFESYLTLVLTALGGLWVFTLRFSRQATKQLAFLFVTAVVGYVLLSKGFEDQIKPRLDNHNFGFFPNRNHTGNLIALGFLCGGGLVFQALRNKKIVTLVVGLLFEGILLWAILSWNYSRAAPLLCVVGVVAWVFCLGLPYFGSREIKVGGLMALLGTGVFFLSDFDVKDRLTQTTSQLGVMEERTLPGEEEGEGEKGAESRKIDYIDLRVPIMGDTFGLIGAFPLTGVGAGEYRWVFPHYWEKMSVMEFDVVFHPESSWLWFAAEWGMPSALCLLVLVGYCYCKGFANIKRRGKRDRALRFGCLVASAMVPLHSVFDVPAHRPALFFASVFLFALSQNVSPEVERGETVSRPRWVFRLVGFFLLVGGILVVWNPGLGPGEPLVVSPRARVDEAIEKYREVMERENGPGSPLETVALREEIGATVTGATQDHPLDNRLYRLRGLALQPLMFRADEVKRDFAIDCALSPYSTSIPLVHAASAVPYNRDTVKRGWSEALARAQWIDDQIGAGSRRREKVLEEIKRRTRRSLTLKDLANEVISPKNQ